MTEKLAHKLDIPPFKGRILSDYDVPAVVDSLKDCDALLEKSRIIEDSRNRVGIVSIPGMKGNVWRI